MTDIETGYRGRPLDASTDASPFEAGLLEQPAAIAGFDIRPCLPPRHVTVRSRAGSGPMGTLPAGVRAEPGGRSRRLERDLAGLAGNSRQLGGWERHDGESGCKIADIRGRPGTS